MTSPGKNIIAVGSLIPDWQSIVTDLHHCQHSVQSTQTSIGMLNRIHTKIRKNPDFWNLKAAKKCKRLYTEALDKTRQEQQRLSDLSARVETLLSVLHSNAEGSPSRTSLDPQQLRIKRRKIEQHAPDEDSSMLKQKSDSVPVGAQVAARIRKEASLVWILASVIRFHPDKQKYDVIDAELDENSPDYKRLYVVPAPHVLALPQTPELAPVLKAGTSVLAQYPDTTCFYKATMVNPQSIATRFLCQVLFEDDGGQYRLIAANRLVAWDE